MNKKIAVHVTNEEQWNEVNKYYDAGLENWDTTHLLIPKDSDIAISSDKYWFYLRYYVVHNDEYEILEFNEWQARMNEEKMVEKIEIPRAVYDEFIELKQAFISPTTYTIMVNSKNELSKYIFGLCGTVDDKTLIQHELNLTKVMAGEAEFVPVEGAYYWQDVQGRWLGYYGEDNEITNYSVKLGADKLTETEIREKTSFDIDKLKKVSE